MPKRAVIHTIKRVNNQSVASSQHGCSIFVGPIRLEGCLMDYEVIAKEIFLDTGPLEAKCKFVSSRVMRIAVADGNTPAIANI